MVDTLVFLDFRFSRANGVIEQDDIYSILGGVRELSPTLLLIQSLF